MIELRLNTRLDFYPGAMAYALPYAGTTYAGMTIVVFYDRIQAARCRHYWHTSWYTRSHTFWRVPTVIPAPGL